MNWDGMRIAYVRPAAANASRKGKLSKAMVLKSSLFIVMKDYSVPYGSSIRNTMIRIFGMFSLRRVAIGSKQYHFEERLCVPLPHKKISKEEDFVIVRRFWNIWAIVRKFALQSRMGCSKNIKTGRSAHGQSRIFAVSVNRAHSGFFCLMIF